ncbi:MULTISPECIES: hypothetical protein [Streptomyces]|uniref:Uncharacterized protein n=1 Tax=Streptomyces rhizosphaericus TaxID=114699 RepID=A0A6G4AH95_9ACTN|nr:MULTISPECIES: hypothetical protein [Streptomyces]NEW72713.1 hypothetical protein [Streptomyces rhizosphaericus]
MGLRRRTPSSSPNRPVRTCRSASARTTASARKLARIELQVTLSTVLRRMPVVW